ncbi:hypothetical protein DL96DRAFT_1054622 [Flagelloscypha sp. PMI_526]|nr:hypothetical protein DL96DRAFT_1054622 [Flagelloscypha sp. PMI_526]
MATIMLSPHRTHPTTIISLPQEILDRVIGYVADDLTSLNALGRICKSLHPLCQQTMYKSVKTMDHPSLIEALSLPHNACSVHVLQVVSLRHLRDMLARHTCLPMLRQLTVQEDAFKKPPNWNNVSTQFQKQILNLLGSTTLDKSAVSRKTIF